MKSIILGLSLASVAAAQVFDSPFAATVTADAPQITSPPDFYQRMPYGDFSSGGYKNLECGYGYHRNADGYCAPHPWVS
jgi:hypothetical protein